MSLDPVHSPNLMHHYFKSNTLLTWGKEETKYSGRSFPACLNLRRISSRISIFDFHGYFDTYLLRKWKFEAGDIFFSLKTDLSPKEARLGCYNFSFLFTRRRQTKTLWQHLYNFLNFLLAFVYFSTNFLFLELKITHPKFFSMPYTTCIKVHF